MFGKPQLLASEGMLSGLTSRRGNPRARLKISRTGTRGRHQWATGPILSANVNTAAEAHRVVARAKFPPPY